MRALRVEVARANATNVHMAARVEAWARSDRTTVSDRAIFAEPPPSRASLAATFRLPGRIDSLHRDATEMRLMASQHRVFTAAGATRSAAGGVGIDIRRATARDLQPLRASCVDDVLQKAW